MNSQPHTHAPKVRDASSFVEITYGDTQVTVWKRFGRLSERRLRRHVRRAIRRHDRGSVRAGRTADLVAIVVADEMARQSERWPA